MRAASLTAVALVLSMAMMAQDKYMGPRPQKVDVPYLLHADTLIEIEAGTAAQETRKDSTIAVISGASSPVKTPLSEPAFIIRTDRQQADKFELYKLDSKNGKREVVIGQKKGKGMGRPVYLQITRLDDKLFRIEVDEPLENGEYSLTPQGSDNTYSFAIY
ncbi:MAG: hypothetical protein SGI92_14730 [Bryobacteraceae bacterium]|nr:hypothetical protein [Bryobacteraceae bacterium]